MYTKVCSTHFFFFFENSRVGTHSRKPVVSIRLSSVEKKCYDGQDRCVTLHFVVFQVKKTSCSVDDDWWKLPSCRMVFTYLRALGQTHQWAKQKKKKKKCWHVSVSKIDRGTQTLKKKVYTYIFPHLIFFISLYICGSPENYRLSSIDLFKNYSYPIMCITKK